MLHSHLAVPPRTPPPPFAVVQSPSRRYGLAARQASLSRAISWTLPKFTSTELVMPCPSVQFSRSVMSDSLRPHRLQHSRPPCPLPTPGVYPKPCSLMPSNHLILCHPFSSCPQSFPVSGSFQMSQLFASGGQSIRVSASASVLPMNIQD